MSQYALKCGTAKSLQKMFQADLESCRDTCNNNIVVHYSGPVDVIFFRAQAKQRNAHSSDIPSNDSMCAIYPVMMKFDD